MAVKNDCSPSNVYGSYQHTLFLGWSVMDFTATAGWNEQYSTLTVKLVQDPCAGTRKYLDTNFNWVSADFPAGDPAFNGVIGQAAIFKVEDFEFAGIIQSVTEAKSSSGFPTRNVTLISPGVILEGTQVIIDGYSGGVSALPNVVNLYAFLESLNLNCPPVGGFGSPAGGFGFARRTDRGIPWSLAKPGLQVLLGGTGSALYSPHGGMKWKAGFSGYGLIASDYYALDISELPTTTGIDYRIPGPSASIQEIISLVAKDAGYDYYVDLLPSKGGPGGIVTNIIKIRTINRRNQPALGSISTFVNNSSNIIDNSIGQELRAENHSAFIVGGSKKQVYQRSGVLPFFGFDDYGNINVASNTGDQWVINTSIQSLNNSLSPDITGYTSGPASGYITFTESELLSSTADRDIFASYVVKSHPTGHLASYITGTLGIEPIKSLRGDGSFAGEHPARDEKIPIDGVSLTSNDYENVEYLQSWLKSFTDNIYGKQFLVPIPFVCVTTDTDTGEYLWSDLPSTDGGWPESTGLLTIPFPSQTTNNYFADQQGKIGAIVKYDDDLTTSLNSDEFTPGSYFFSGGFPTYSLWVPAEVDEKWVVYNNSVYALLSVPNVMRDGSNEMNADSVRSLAGANFRSPETVNVKINASLDRSDVSSNIDRPAIFPAAAAVPILSNTQTYGPWVGTASAKGKVYFEKDDGLVPWEYGSASYMNLAATAKITNTITNTQLSERGSVTLAGYPTVGLGSAISTSLSSVVSRGVVIGTNAAGQFYYTSAYGTDTSAAQISNINVTVGAQGVTTKVDVTAFTPVQGRFTRNNAERVKQIGQNKYRALRPDLKPKISSSFTVKSGSGGGSRRSSGSSMDSKNSKGDASSVIAAKKSPTSGTVATFSSMTPVSAASGYEDTAVMTIDGILKPIKKIGARGTFASEVQSPTPPSSQPNYTWAPTPPLDQYTQPVVNTDYLDFLSNPSGLVANRSASSGQGHNVEGVARGTVSNTQGNLSIPQAEVTGAVGYASGVEGYRYLGLRGPLVVHGWGYDVAGKPVPNEYELGTGEGGVPQSGAISGQFKVDYSGLSDKFYNGFLQDDTTWPAAPVDLRYDRKRGVWTTPPGFKILQVEATGIIKAGTSRTVNVLNAGDSYDASGNLISGTVLLTNFTDVDVCSGRLMAQYDELNDQYWPLFPGETGCDSCIGQDCSFISVSGTGGDEPSGLYWQDQEDCCSTSYCIDPTGAPTGTGITYVSECAECEGAACVYSGIAGTGAGHFVWSESSSGCCDNFTCSEPTGSPTGLGDIFNGSCEPCDGSACIYSGVGGEWVADSGNCNGDCGSGTVQCTEPTGSPTGDGAIQSGTCEPCDGYPCRFVGVSGSWVETGVGCTGCENESGTYRCIPPQGSPTGEGEIFVSECEPPLPTGTKSCTINEISLNCGLGDGIEITTTPITFTVSGDGIVCSAGSGTTVLCDTCCSGGGGTDPTGTPTGQCDYQMCGYTAYCVGGGYPPLGPCPASFLQWQLQVDCQNGCGCIEPPYAPSEAQEGYVSDCGDPSAPTDQGGGEDPIVPIVDPVFGGDDTPPVWEDPTAPTSPTVDEGPVTPIAYQTTSPYTPNSMTVQFYEDMNYTDPYARVKPIDSKNFKPIRALWGTGVFGDALSGTGDGGVSGYLPYFQMASTYAVRNPIKRYTRELLQDCSDTTCSGDACYYTSTGTNIEDWVLTTACTGGNPLGENNCACECPYPTSAPFISGQVLGRTCDVVTGDGGAPQTGIHYTTGIQYEYSVKSGSIANVVPYSGSIYTILDFTKVFKNITGDFNDLLFYDKIFADASSGDITVTLPLSYTTGVQHQQWYVKKVDTSSNTVTISGDGGDLIDGQSTQVLTNAYQSLTFTTAKSGEWYII